MQVHGLQLWARIMQSSTIKRFSTAAQKLLSVATISREQLMNSRGDTPLMVSFSMLLHFHLHCKVIHCVRTHVLLECGAVIVSSLEPKRAQVRLNRSLIFLLAGGRNLLFQSLSKHSVEVTCFDDMSRIWSECLWPWNVVWIDRFMWIVSCDLTIKVGRLQASHLLPIQFYRFGNNIQQPSLCLVVESKSATPSSIANSLNQERLRSQNGLANWIRRLSIGRSFSTGMDTMLSFILCQ